MHVCLTVFVFFDGGDPRESVPGGSPVAPRSPPGRLSIGVAATADIAKFRFCAPGGPKKMSFQHVLKSFQHNFRLFHPLGSLQVQFVGSNLDSEINDCALGRAWADNSSSVFKLFLNCAKTADPPLRPHFFYQRILVFRMSSRAGAARRRGKHGQQNKGKHKK